jgi:SAM-dependent methyltransferase
LVQVLMTLLLALIGGVIGVWMVRRRRSASESTDGLSIAVAGVKAAEDEDDFAWLRTPCDVGHPAAWDRYWEGQLAHGNVASAFGDMMSSNRELPGLLRRRGVRRVLCAGSGLSAEPHALARMGFDVTALDLSPRATELGPTLDFGPDPRMHRAEGASAAAVPPGTLSYIAGDLLDASICPGPFDCIIERRTVQLLPDRELALDRLAARLGLRGLLISHVHGAWRPGLSREHFAQRWALKRGFSHNDEAERAVMLQVTTG